MIKKNVKNGIKFFFVIVVLLCIICFLGKIFFDSSKVIDSANYKKTISVIKNKDKISHFPVEIPKNAKSVKLYVQTSENNGEIILLQIKVDKKYIEQELKKNLYINSNCPVGSQQNIYYFPVVKGFIKPQNYTFYVLKNKDNEYFYKKYFPYFNGVGVDKNYEHIIYYYIDPGD